MNEKFYEANVKNTNLCFISGKMRGLKKRECIDNFRKAHAHLISRSFDVIDPTWLEIIAPGLSDETYMKIDLILLSFCSHIYMLSNYKDSEGAQAELRYAKLLGLKVFYQNEEDEI